MHGSSWGPRRWLAAIIATIAIVFSAFTAGNDNQVQAGAPGDTTIIINHGCSRPPNGARENSI